MNPLERLSVRLKEHKLSRDIAYTLGSFVVLAVSGLVINIVIAGLRDATALGVFNQSYAVYIVASQFAVFGLHYSVMRHAALHESNSTERGRLLLTAGACSVGLGVFAAALVFFGEPLFVAAFDSEATGHAIRYGALGLVLFPLTKVLLAYLNALRRMKAFSVLQAIRYVLVMGVASGVAGSALPIEAATLGFVVAEVVTASAALVYIYRRNLVGRLAFSRTWVLQHFAFGSKGLMAGMFTEVNSRIDVLIIGFFLSDRAVGIYSFAAMLVDGLYHILAVVRLNFNPLLVGAMRDQDWAQSQRLLGRSKKIVWPLTAGLALLTIGGFYILAVGVAPEKGLLEGMPSLLILLAGLTLISPFVPFDNLLMVIGHPGYQTLQQLTTVGSNAVVAMLLLPLVGIEGAAIGTAVSYLAGVIMLLLFARRMARWNLITNTVKA